MAESLADGLSNALMDLTREMIADDEEMDSADDELTLVDLSSVRRRSGFDCQHWHTDDFGSVDTHVCTGFVPLDQYRWRSATERQQAWLISCSPTIRETDSVSIVGHSETGTQ